LSVVSNVQSAYSQREVLVRVTIERVASVGGFSGDAPDFYARIVIDGSEFNNEDSAEQNALEDRATIAPNWVFSKLVDVSKGNIIAKIWIMDEDGGFRFGDDPVDINS
jgi:hypothetical protein